MQNRLDSLITLATPDIEAECGGLLEIRIEPGGYGAHTDESLQRLRGHGLARALGDAQAALAVAGGSLPPSRGWIHEPPVWQVANPDQRLSNTAGAALGIALGWLLYDGRCPGQRLIASGRFRPLDASGNARLASDPQLAIKLRTALALGFHATPLPFLVPAHTAVGVETKQNCAEQIAQLAALNIYVFPVLSLEEAVATCRRLESENPSKTR